jgi:ethanolamine utilization microcompartment shell protein EutS
MDAATPLGRALSGDGGGEGDGDPPGPTWALACLDEGDARICLLDCSFRSHPSITRMWSGPFFENKVVPKRFVADPDGFARGRAVVRAAIAVLARFQPEWVPSLTEGQLVELQERASCSDWSSSAAPSMNLVLSLLSRFKGRLHNKIIATVEAAVKAISETADLEETADMVMLRLTEGRGAAAAAAEPATDASAAAAAEPATDASAAAAAEPATDASAAGAAAVAVATDKADRSKPTARDPRVIFVHVESLMELESGSLSPKNLVEASLCEALTRAAASQPGCKEGDIGIITPYREQCSLIQERLGGDLPGVRINTVDSFQGSEVSYAILSTVRSSVQRKTATATSRLRPGYQNSLAFLRDAKRGLVALSRARDALVVVGDGTLLRKDRCWAGLMAYAAITGGFCSLTQGAISSGSLKSVVPEDVEMVDPAEGADGDEQDEHPSSDDDEEDDDYEQPSEEEDTSSVARAASTVVTEPDVHGSESDFASVAASTVADDTRL